MKHWKPFDKLTRSAGATLVETGLILPIVLLFLIGAADLGRGIWSYNVIAEAAREGGRYAVVHGGLSSQPVGPTANDPRVEQVVRSYCVGLDPSRVSVTSTWVNGDNNHGSSVRIRVDYGFVPVVSSIVGSRNLALKTTSQMVVSH